MRMPAVLSQLASTLTPVLVALTVTSTYPDSVASGTVVVYDRRVPQRIPKGRTLVVAPDASSDL